MDPLENRNIFKNHCSLYNFKQFPHLLGPRFSLPPSKTCRRSASSPGITSYFPDHLPAAVNQHTSFPLSFSPLTILFRVWLLTSKFVSFWWEILPVFAFHFDNNDVHFNLYSRVHAVISSLIYASCQKLRNSIAI